MNYPIHKLVMNAIRKHGMQTDRVAKFTLLTDDLNDTRVLKIVRYDYTSFTFASDVEHEKILAFTLKQIECNPLYN